MPSSNQLGPHLCMCIIIPIAVCTCTPLHWGCCAKILYPIRRREVGVLLDIVHAQQYTSEWQFLQGILAIQAADNKLQLWNGVVPLKVGALCYQGTMYTEDDVQQSSPDLPIRPDGCVYIHMACA